MKALIQRVTQASVSVDEETVGRIGPGLLVLLGVEKDDTDQSVQRMADKLLGYRIFADTAGRMNRSVTDVGGGVLIVSQFTLAADTRKGLRPSFSSAAEPAEAERLYDALVHRVADRGVSVSSGRFAADMQVHLVNDGPVTFLLDV